MESAVSKSPQLDAQRLAAIVQSSQDAILAIDLAGAITAWNPAAERMYGWTSEEVLGRHISLLIPRSRIGEAEGIIQRLRSGVRVLTHETTRKHKCGTEIDVSLTISPILGERGGLIGVSKIARDITARKKAEQGAARQALALKEGEERYRLLVESIPHMVWTTTADGFTDFLNQRAAVQLGVRPEAVHGWGWLDLVHPDDVASAGKTWEASFASRTNYRNEYRVRQINGAYRWYLAQAVPLPGPNGEIHKWVGTWTDIDDRKRAEEALAWDAKLLANVRDAVVVTDNSNRITYWNTGAARLFGWTKDEIVGQPAPYPLLEQLQQAANGPHGEFRPVSGRSVEHEVRRKDGARIWVDTRATHLSDECGRVVGVIRISHDISERKQAEAELHRTTTLLRAVTDGTPDAVFVKDLEGRYLLFNPAAAGFVGKPAAEVLGRDDTELFAPADAHLIIERDRRVMRTGRTETTEEVLTAAGATRTYLATKAPFLDERGRVAGTIGVSRDITDWKTAIDALQASEERFRTFMEHCPAATFIKDEEGRFLYVNPAWLRQFDTDLSDYLGKTDFDVWPRETAELFRASDAACLARNAVLQTEERARIPGEDDDRTWLVMKFPLDYGTHRHVCGMAWDVTDRRKAERTLQLRDRAIQAVTQGILITDPFRPDNPIIYASPGFEQLTGYTAQEVLGRNCRFLQGEGTDPEAKARLAAAIREAHPCTIEILNFRKDGTPFWNSLSISPVRDASGMLTHFVGVQTDVTERRRLEEQVRQSQKMEAVGQLAGGIAHDFNNLLTIISGFCEMLLDSPECAETSRGPLQEISKAADRSASLTRQLLAFSRRQVLVPKILNVNAVIEHSEKMLRRLIGEDIQLTVSLSRELHRVKADQGQIEQVILNLVVNARDAMPRGGELVIETRNVTGDSIAALQAQADEDWICLAVKDTGIGMSNQTLQHLFEPFFTTKGPGKGTGLGLAVIHGIVTQSGGHVEVESEAGKGTTFRIYLPAEKAGEQTESLRVSPNELLRGTETVLLVEDDDAVRSLGRQILVRSGYRVLEAANGQSALELCSRSRARIDLVVTDVVMPTMGGRQLVEQLVSFLPEVKVLYLSGYTDDAVVRHGILQDQVNFLQKPFTPNTLLQKIRQILNE